MEEKWFVRVLVGGAVVAVLLLAGLRLANAAGTVCQIGNGCTGTSTAPSYGKVLIGDTNGNYELTATSSLGFPTSGTVTSVTASTPNSTLSVGGTNPVTTSGTISFDLNLAHTNWWTARQNFTTASTSNFEATSTDIFLDGYASALLSVNSSHQLTAYAGSSDPCSANQAPTTLSALGVLGGCTSTFLTSAVTSVNGTTNQITSSGGNTPTLSLPNLVVIPLDASSTELSVFTKAFFGGTATTTIDSAGNIAGATNATITFSNASTTDLSIGGNTTTGLRYVSFFYATSTTWTGSTTPLVLGVIPIGFTLLSTQCSTATSTTDTTGTYKLNVQYQYGTAGTSLAMLNASTTVGTFTWGSSNTPTAGSLLQVVAGTPTNSPTQIGCTATLKQT
jgi:hypothetical protein